MPSRFLIYLGLVFSLGTGFSLAQQPATLNPDEAWQRYDWLKDTSSSQGQTVAGGTIQTTTSRDIKDPATVLTSGSLWQEKYGVVYTRPVAETLSLSCETSAVTVGEGGSAYLPPGYDEGGDLYQGQKISLNFHPVDAFSLNANLHNSMSGSALPGDTSVTNGAGLYLTSHLPMQSVLTLGINSDRSGTEQVPASQSQDTSFDAQLQRPLSSSIPLTGVLKGRFEQISTPGAPTTNLPTLEQSLIWKPVSDTTVQMGLRQQQYESYPGVAQVLNEAVFADWSQNLPNNISWHSYAELLNTSSLLNDAPASPIASGSNGTAQATAPGSNAGLGSLLPLSFTDQTVTFSTGPSFKLQQDISASVEYSNRWDKTPSAGSVGVEQRVSVSVKGSF